jgi:hypothetical protein
MRLNNPFFFLRVILSDFANVSAGDVNFSATCGLNERCQARRLISSSNFRTCK